MSADTPEESPVRPEWVSRRAVAWVIDDAPVPSDLAFTLTVIARRCDQDGKGSFQSKRTMAKATGKSEDQVQRDVQDLLERKLIRLGDQSLPGKFGIKPGQWPTVYDVALEMKGPKPGKKSKNPSGRKKPAPEPTEDTPRMDATPRMEARGGMEAPGTPRMEAPSTPRMDAPQRDPSKNPSNNPSSLSARTSVTAAREDADDRERDESATPEDPKPNTPDYQVLAEEGVDTDEAHQLIPVIVEQCKVKTPGFWRHVQRNRDIVGIIAAARAHLATAGGCAHCNGTGKVPGYSQYGDTPIEHDCPACTPMTSESRSAFVAQLAGQPCCDHGWEGGNLPMPYTGWMRCADCRRASGYVPVEERDRQRRSSDRESAEERNMRGWMTTPLGPDVPVMHPQHPRRMINSHANQDRYDEKL